MQLHFFFICFRRWNGMIWTTCVHAYIHIKLLKLAIKGLLLNRAFVVQCISIHIKTYLKNMSIWPWLCCKDICNKLITEDLTHLLCKQFLGKPLGAVLKIVEDRREEFRKTSHSLEIISRCHFWYFSSIISPFNKLWLYVSFR